MYTNLFYYVPLEPDRARRSSLECTQKLEFKETVKCTNFFTCLTHNAAYIHTMDLTKNNVKNNEYKLLCSLDSV